MSKRKPILVFIQQTDFDAKQAVFVNEVSDYKQGFFRASFSDPQELLKAIVQGLSRMEKSNNSLPEKAFHERIKDASSSRSYGGQSYARSLSLLFCPNL